MNTEQLLSYLSNCVENGKDKKETPIPPELKGKDGALEITQTLLDQAVSPDTILKQSLMPGMDRIGERYSQGKAFVPHLLLASRAMNASLNLLKPYFDSGDIEQKGTFIIGTVKGDLHDIGKNLVRSIVQGSGWEIVDLGTDVGADKFLESLAEYPHAFVGLSALLTTTMINMEGIVKSIKEKYPDKKILIGGAPVTEEYMESIGADFCSHDPKSAADYLNTFV